MNTGLKTTCPPWLSGDGPGRPEPPARTCEPGRCPPGSQTSSRGSRGFPRPPISTGPPAPGFAGGNTGLFHATAFGGPGGGAPQESAPETATPPAFAALPGP